MSCLGQNGRSLYRIRENHQTPGGLVKKFGKITNLLLTAPGFIPYNILWQTSLPGKRRGGEAQGIEYGSGDETERDRAERRRRGMQKLSGTRIGFGRNSGKHCAPTRQSVPRDGESFRFWYGGTDPAYFIGGNLCLHVFLLCCLLRTQQLASAETEH